MRQVEAVQILCFLRFLREVNNVWHALLHPESQFVRGDSRGGGRVVWIFDAAQGVEPFHETESLGLGLFSKRPLGRAKVKRVGGVNAKRHRVVSWPQIDAVFFVPVFSRAD